MLGIRLMNECTKDGVRTNRKQDMKMRIALIFSLVGMGTMFGSMTGQAATLLEIDFEELAPFNSTIASTDSQFTVVHPALTFGAPGSALSFIGGNSGTGGWVYDGTGTAAANGDLHTGSTFGSPTRFDIDLGLAASGYLSYTITSVELDIRASNSAGTEWDFMYRDSVGTTHITSGGAIAVQSGAAPIGNYSIDVSSENLTATQSTTAWSTAANGKLRYGFFEPNGTGPSDNFQVDAIRFIGTVTPVPEVSSVGLFALMGCCLVVLRRLHHKA